MNSWVVGSVVKVGSPVHEAAGAPLLTGRLAPG